MASRRVMSLTSGAAVIAAIAATALMGPSRPAVAAIGNGPPCYGPTCVGRSPNITNDLGQSCADSAVDVSGSRLYVEGDADIVVRWSAWCHANWVRWEADDYAPGTKQFYVQSADGFLQYNSYDYYTPMVNGVETVRECFAYPNGGACLGWF